MEGRHQKNNCRWALAAFAAFFWLAVQADEGFENDDPTTWTWPFPFILSGDEALTNDTCVIASNGRNTRTRTYRIRVSDLNSSGFILEQVTPNTSGRLPISLIWADPTDGDFVLADGTQENTRFTGNLAGNCTRVSSLEVGITEFDYLSVEAGNYYDAFELRARVGRTNVFSTVFIDVDVPEFVRVSFPMGDIAVPFSTTVDQLVVEPFCIYTNAANGGVGVAISVANNDTDGTNSVLERDSGADQIDYSFEFRTAGGGTTLGTVDTESGMAEVATASAATDSNICAISGNTHELAVSVTAADMAAASAGSYSDTISVIVEPAL